MKNTKAILTALLITGLSVGQAFGAPHSLGNRPPQQGLQLPQTWADLSSLPPDLPNYNDLLFGTGAGSVLTKEDRAALQISRKWMDGGRFKPVQGPDGSVRFIFGAFQPCIVCAVMQITDIELEPGEVVNSLHIGDTARWLIEPAVTGSANGEVQHIIVKPVDTGLETSMVATTNRRTYHMRLKSDTKQYMPKVSFVYPGAVLAEWQSRQGIKQEEVKNKTIPETGAYMDNLDFNYKIDGSASWKPVRVYNDGVKTIIQLPGKSVREAPTLLLMRGSEQVMANYRLQENRFVVDEVFDKAILITGIGRNQTKVTITRTSK